MASRTFTSSRNLFSRSAATSEFTKTLSKKASTGSRRAAEAEEIESEVADAVTAALNAQIKNGNYDKTLAHWGLTAERVEKSRSNPAGLPKS